MFKGRRELQPPLLSPDHTWRGGRWQGLQGLRRLAGHMVAAFIAAAPGWAHGCCVHCCAAWLGTWLLRLLLRRACSLRQHKPRVKQVHPSAKGCEDKRKAAGTQWLLLLLPAACVSPGTDFFFGVPRRCCARYSLDFSTRDGASGNTCGTRQAAKQPSNNATHARRTKTEVGQLYGTCDDL